MGVRRGNAKLWTSALHSQNLPFMRGSVWVYRMASQQVDVWVLHIAKGIYERSIARYVAQTFVHISLGQFGGPAVDTVMV